MHKDPSFETMVANQVRDNVHVTPADLQRHNKLLTDEMRLKHRHVEYKLDKLTESVTKLCEVAEESVKKQQEKPPSKMTWTEHIRLFFANILTMFTFTHVHRIVTDSYLIDPEIPNFENQKYWNDRRQGILIARKLNDLFSAAAPKPVVGTPEMSMPGLQTTSLHSKRYMNFYEIDVKYSVDTILRMVKGPGWIVIDNHIYNVSLGAASGRRIAWWPYYRRDPFWLRAVRAICSSCPVKYGDMKYAALDTPIFRDMIAPVKQKHERHAINNPPSEFVISTASEQTHEKKQECILKMSDINYIKRIRD